MLNEPALKIEKSILFAFAGIVTISIGISIYAQNLLFSVVPIGILFLVLSITNYKYIFYLLIASIPISIHLKLGSLALEVPSEPLMIVLLILFPLIFLIHYKDFQFLYHPIIFILVCQYVWAIFSSFFSVDYVVSIKYLIAKLWFILPYVFIGGLVLNKGNDFKKIFWLFFIPLLLTVITTTIIHAQKGFSFEAANSVMNPYFQNHVDYSTTIAIFLPYVWFARYWYKPYSYVRLLINFGFILFTFAVIISFTRASWLAIAVLIPGYWVIKNKLTKMAIIIGLVGLIIGLVYVYDQNRYLDYSKDYTKVIFHQGDIEKHLEATYQMEDVSGMERVYRWMAAQNMIKDKFFTGSGPNTFYPEYKKYAIVMFQTYVSDNPERSTTHNYFLMVFSEQGIIGFLLFGILYILLLLKGTELFNSVSDSYQKNLGMAATLSLIMLFIHLCFNDLIETDNSGTLFYLAIALILKLAYWKNQEVKIQNR
jgi:O-antigen ligase